MTISLLCSCYTGDINQPSIGCPPESAAKRRWLNHNTCGLVVDPDDPEYYLSGVEEEEIASYSDYAVGPSPLSVMRAPARGLRDASSVGIDSSAAGPSSGQDTDPVPEIYCRGEYVPGSGVILPPLQCIEQR